MRCVWRRCKRNANTCSKGVKQGACGQLANRQISHWKAPADAAAPGPQYKYTTTSKGMHHHVSQFQKLGKEKVLRLLPAAAWSAAPTIIRIRAAAIAKRRTPARTQSKGKVSRKELPRHLPITQCTVCRTVLYCRGDEAKVRWSGQKAFHI